MDVCALAGSCTTTGTRTTPPRNQPSYRTARQQQVCTATLAASHRAEVRRSQRHRPQRTAAPNGAWAAQEQPSTLLYRKSQRSVPSMLTADRGNEHARAASSHRAGDDALGGSAPSRQVVKRRSHLKWSRHSPPARTKARAPPRFRGPIGAPEDIELARQGALGLRRYKRLGQPCGPRTARSGGQDPSQTFGFAVGARASDRADRGSAAARSRAPSAQTARAWPGRNHGSPRAPSAALERNRRGTNSEPHAGLPPHARLAHRAARPPTKAPGPHQRRELRNLRGSTVEGP